MSINVKARVSISHVHKAKIEKVIVFKSDAILDIISESIQQASNFADESELWAVGEIADLPAGSAKYWAMRSARSAFAATASASTASTKAGEAFTSADSALNSKSYASISEVKALDAESGAKQAEQSAANSSSNAEYWGRKASEYADAMKPDHIALLVGSWATPLANEILEARLLGYTGTRGNSRLEAVLAGDFMPASSFAIPYARLNDMLENRLAGFSIGSGENNLEVILHGN